MSILSRKLAPLVGAGAFFAHVSSRAAFMLPPAHECGLVCGNGDRSTRPGSHTDFDFDFFATERATAFNAYDGNPANQKMVLAGERVLMGVLPPCTVPGELMVVRSTAAVSHATILNGSDLSDSGVVVNDCLHDVVPVVDFPAFDLYVSALHRDLVDDSDPLSFQTVMAACNADMTDRISLHAEDGLAMLPMSESCSEWMVWMVATADIPLNSSVRIHGTRLTAGK